MNFSFSGHMSIIMASYNDVKLCFTLWIIVVISELVIVVSCLKSNVRICKLFDIAVLIVLLRQMYQSIKTFKGFVDSFYTLHHIFKIFWSVVHEIHTAVNLTKFDGSLLCFLAMLMTYFTVNSTLRIAFHNLMKTAFNTCQPKNYSMDYKKKLPIHQFYYLQGNTLFTPTLLMYL